MGISICAEWLKDQPRNLCSGHAVVIGGERINCCNGSCTQEYKILDSSATRPTDPDDGSYWIAKDDVLGGIEAMQNHESNERLAFEQQIVEIQAEYKKTKYVGEKALQAAEKNQASAKSLSAIVFSPKYEAEFKLKRTLQTLQEQRRKMDVLNWIDSN